MKESSLWDQRYSGRSGAPLGGGSVLNAAAWADGKGTQSGGLGSVAIV